MHFNPLKLQTKNSWVFLQVRRIFSEKQYTKFYGYPHHQNRLGHMLKPPNESSVCRRIYGRYVKHKRNDPKCDPWDSQGDEKLQFLFLLLFALTFLSQMKI